jgi:outer membrane protein OmpA-like peptidoglycan-associated protein
MKHYFPAFVISILSVAFTNGISIAQEANADVEGSKDHPLFNRMQGVHIAEYDDKDFEAYDFVVGPEKQQHVEGHRTTIIYALNEGAKAAGRLQILRNYSNAIKKIGGSLMYQESENGSEVLRLVKGGNEIWVEVTPDAGWGDGCYRLTIVEKKELEQEITANDMLDALNKEGHVALYINFATGKSDIQSESAPIIDQIADMMKKNPDLSINVEGHTDNVGKPKDNQALSEQRAKAVAAALVKQGIDAKRLTAVGFGQDKPIADNKTEEGRAKNRRVELVKK